MNKSIYILICSVLTFFTTNAQLDPVSYHDGNSKLNGWAAIPEKKLTENPGVLVLHAWKGIDNHAKDSALKLWALGYHVFIADIYGEGNYPNNTKEAGQRAGYYKKNPLQYQNRIRKALEQLQKAGANPDKIVIIGYCFGGTGAIEAARGQLPIEGVVSFHGGLAKIDERKTTVINTKILVCHGADDKNESPEKISAFHDEMRSANADWQMIYYANAVHSFTDPAAGNDNSKGNAYNEKAAKRSWEHLMDFLKEVL